MRIANGLDLSIKLPIFIAAMVAVTVVGQGGLGYITARNLVIEGAIENRDTLTSAKASYLSTFLKQIDKGLETQSKDPEVARAITEFSAAFASFDTPLKTLTKAYITDNPFPVGEKDKQYGSDLNSSYDLVHRKYHAMFSTLKDSMGYYDVFLFDADGNLIYSVFKELDYATNMIEGERKDTGLAEAFRLASALGADEPAAFVDFAPYGPSYDAPAAFIARPVFDAGGTRLGAIAYQMPVDRLNAIADQELGETGHVFVLGSDGLMRTDSHLTEENDVIATSVSPELQQTVQAGIGHSLSYINRFGTPMVADFWHVDFDGADWAIVAEQSTEELFADLPGVAMQQIVTGGAFLGLATFLSILIAMSVSRPVQSLAETVGKIAGKDYDIEVAGAERGDEIGRIAKALDQFRGDLKAAEAAAIDAAFKGAAFEATGGPMLLSDLDQTCIGANAAFERLTRESPDEFGLGQNPGILGRKLAELGFLPTQILNDMMDHSKVPIRGKLRIGELYVGMMVDIVRDREGSAVGYLIDLKNQTAQMASEVLVNAIDSKQVRVEFDISGKIKRHNRYFADLLGLEQEALPDIIGKETIKSESKAVDIWAEAQHGDATMGRFLVSGSQGHRILDGSFNPVPDQNGETAGFLLIGADVTEERQQAVAAERTARENAENQAVVVDRLSVGLRRLAEGDLTGLIDEPFEKDYDQLRQDFNEAMTKLEGVICDVVIDASSIGNESSGISSSVSELARRTESQAATLEETAAALHQLTTSVSSSAKGAANAAEIASEARHNAQASSGIVKETADAMTQIEASSQEVAKIIGVIDDIAFQTNLLALNAGVEAARAGSAGRGFAVVASEVRALAQRCLEASSDISNLISASGDHVERGVALVGKTATELENIAASVLEISDNVGQIASATQEQSSGLTEINQALSQLDQATQQNAAMAEETTAAAQSLLGEADHLTETTASFRTRGAAGKLASVQVA